MKSWVCLACHPFPAVTCVSSPVTTTDPADPTRPLGPNIPPPSRVASGTRLAATADLPPTHTPSDTPPPPRQQGGVGPGARLAVLARGDGPARALLLRRPVPGAGRAGAAGAACLRTRRTRPARLGAQVSRGGDSYGGGSGRPG